GQVAETLQKLRDAPETAKHKAKFILATDGKDFQAEDLNSGDTLACAYPDFHEHFTFFFALAGISTVKEIRESSFDIKATGRLNKLYLELLKTNPDWAVPDRRQDMNHFMARLIFCFFAEDTQIFHTANLFTDTVQQMSAGDFTITHKVIGEIFRAMDTQRKDREAQGIANWAKKKNFPYVNGQLFSGGTDCPRFSKIARAYLLHVGNLNWQQINPDIFGSMIQAVADADERGSLGMHYTSVPNILKVLNPLFLDELRQQLVDADNNARKLLNLRKRLAHIRVFDPACGSGNFLVIAYKQLREIEQQINLRRGEADRASDIPLTNFRGIELKGFSAEIARLALIIAEYQCDVLYRGQQKALAEFLPLGAENWIICGNALRLDWLSVCPPTGTGVKVQRQDADLFSPPATETEIAFENEGGETYICGNPPYLGSKKKSKEQSEDMAHVGLAKAQLLDYVCAFIIRGIDVLKNTPSGMALVSTSSICQGEQVALLWPRILGNAYMNFAYRPFKWANSAANNAGVWCTIIGLESKFRKNKRLFDGDQLQLSDNISPYLVPGDDVICTPRSEPLSLLPHMKMGSNAVDGKRLILSPDEYRRVLEEDSRTSKFLKRYGGTKELLSGNHRWCLWIEDSQLDEAHAIPMIMDIIRNCYSYRIGAGRDARKAASRPHAFCYSTFENRNFIHVGNTIGNALDYVSADIRQRGYVSNHNAFTIYDIKLYSFSVIVSTLHRVWAETISGRLGNGTRYGNTVVYNTFPVPTLTSKNKADLTRCAEDILLARERHFPATIADLYKPDQMPEDLRRAHDRNDEVLERIYIGRRFKNDTERLEKLFALYTEMTKGS
ncbi:MAG: DNA methyltransferase, partial [Bacteroidota bacterium]